MLDFPHTKTIRHSVVYIAKWLWLEFILKEKSFGIKLVNNKSHWSRGKAIKW